MEKKDIKLNIAGKLKQIRDGYVINQVKKAIIPEFGNGEIQRYRVTFSGRVQKVGFRLEVCELAKRLGITGFCKNLETGDVLAELQGTEEKVKYLISFMESLKRIKITSKTIEKLKIIECESEFSKQ